MTHPTLDLDELKQVWQRIDHAIGRQHAIASLMQRERRLDRMRASLRPLRWGQLAQIPLGALFVVWAASTWWSFWPLATVRIAAFVVHAYGLGLVASGARTATLLAHIDYGAPVLQIQRQLAEVRRWYDRSGLVLGMAWWLLWLPVLEMIGASSGLDVVARAPATVAGYVIACVMGLLLSLWFVTARHERWPRLRRHLDDAAEGPSLRRAAAVLDEIARFERDDEAPPAATPRP